MADSDASLDAQLELKKRARRRLVGATALVLLAAVVLPMVMDHTPRPPAQDIQVRIPSQDGGFTSRVLPAKPAATPLPPAEGKGAVAEAPKPEAKPEPRAEPPAAKAEALKPEPKTEAKPEKPAEKPAAPDKPAAKPQEKPVEKTAEKKPEEARAAAALTGGGGEWIVQLGAYKEAGNVKLLLAKIKQMGLPVYTEPFDSPQGPRTRVRAGPFASKEAAEKAQARIRTIGVDGPVAQK